LSRLDRPLLVISDAHLGHGVRREVGKALARAIRLHPGHEVVLNGDSFDLSVDPQSRAPAESVSSMLREHGELREALASHLATGAPIVLVSGNHDAELALPEVKRAILGVLELPEHAPLSSSPWLLRRDGVHVEHGHLYDPDNAPNHPLAVWSRQTEPLGVALMRRFVAPARAFDFAHSHESTPLRSFLRTFRIYGRRAPAVVARYFATAFALTASAGRQPGLGEERTAGARSVDAFASESGLDPDVLREIALFGARPTHHRSGATFQRLYLDRSLCTVGILAAAGVALAGGPGAAAVAAALSGYLGFSVARGVNRYGGKLEVRMRDAASAIRDRTGARVVVFGHSHIRDAAPGYLNPGSFAFPRGPGRGVIHVDESRHAERRDVSS
jgi:predicted phosphodiesterase